MTKLSAFLVCLFLYLFLTQPVAASVIVKQIDMYSASLNVWQVIQELGESLSGTAGTFTFRVHTALSNIQQFDYTAQNTRIYDKTVNSEVARGCATGDSQNRLRGLTFSTDGVPEGYENVTMDFSCRNFQFIPGHRYLILITNANRCDGCIKFASTAYGISGQDYFTGGGLRYANGNQFDFSHNGGSCDPLTYI